MELRPSLRRVYVMLNEVEPYGRVAQTLGFQPLIGDTVLSGSPYYSVTLDFGPGSVDGWLASLGSAKHCARNLGTSLSRSRRFEDLGIGFEVLDVCSCIA